MYKSYYVICFLGIGGGFLLIALVCAIQLLMNVISEYHKLKTPTLLRACRITTQKLLYFLAFLACLIRGAYFTTPVSTTLFCYIYKVSFQLCLWGKIILNLDLSTLKTRSDHVFQLESRGSIPMSIKLAFLS